MNRAGAAAALVAGLGASGTLAVTTAPEAPPAPHTPPRPAPALVLYQGKPIRWWASHAVHARRDANQRRRELLRMRARARHHARVHHELVLRYRDARAANRRLQAVQTSPIGSSQLERDFLCIYGGENGGYGWAADTGNSYYGGLQMDSEFEQTYGPEFVRAWGHASNWPRSVQITVAIRAYLSGRGFAPWPNTSRACGLR